MLSHDNCVMSGQDYIQTNSTAATSMKSASAKYTSITKEISLRSNGKCIAQSATKSEGWFLMVEGGIISMRTKIYVSHIHAHIP